MSQSVDINTAISILTLLEKGRLTATERQQIEAALHDLRLAKADPEVWRLMHLPPAQRGVNECHK